MLATVLRGTGAARAAVAGLAVGLAALAGLALWSTDENIRTTARVRASDEVSSYWSNTFLRLSIEGEALNDYLQADSDLNRRPLHSAIGSAAPGLDWLATHGTATDRSAGRSAQETYRSHTELLRDFLAAGRGRSRADAVIEATPVVLTVSTMQKQSVTQLTRKRMDSNAYLTRVEQRNQKLRLAEVVLGGLDLLLLTLCGVVLLSHQRRTERQAVRDALTGLGNRVLLGRQVQVALRGADRHGESVGLLLLDLNDFKEVNDTLGHHAGDVLLQQVATRLLGAVREQDTVARLGGDEFAVVLPRSSVKDVELIAARLLAALQLPVDVDGVTVDVRVSIGAAVYPLQSVDATELMQHADIAMYDAKRRRSGTALYDPDVRTPGARTPESAEPAKHGQLRRARRGNDVAVHYPPGARTENGRGFGVQALPRLQQPVEGLLPPADLAALAAAAELAGPLTDYVLAAAGQRQHAWRQQGLDLPAAVGVTGPYLLDPAFRDRLAGLLARWDTPPGRLTLELIDTAVIGDLDDAMAALSLLELAQGLRIDVVADGVEDAAA